MNSKYDRLIKIFYLISSLAALNLLVSCATVTKPAQIAVVLGAGASKGFAHIGVLKVLESHKIPIHMIVGTSAGAFVGSLYAYGYTGCRHYVGDLFHFNAERNEQGRD